MARRGVASRQSAYAGLARRSRLQYRTARADQCRIRRCLVLDVASREMSTLPRLCGPRVQLRRWRVEDRAPFAAMNSDPRVMEFFRSPLTRSDSDAMADRIERHFDEYGFGLWAIEVPGLAPFIGFAGLTWARFDAHFTPAVEIGWRIAFEHWRHGYATEAARLALDFGFEILALDEVVSFTAADNLRSRAVM